MSRVTPRASTWPSAWPARASKSPASPTACPRAPAWSSLTNSPSAAPSRDEGRYFEGHMQRPSVVVFDLGKVLLDFDYGIAGRKFAKRGKMSFEQLAHLLTQSPLLGRYETGALTTQQF